MQSIGPGATKEVLLYGAQLEPVRFPPLTMKKLTFGQVVRGFCFAAMVSAVPSFGAQAIPRLVSPNDQIAVDVRVGEQIVWDATVGDRAVMQDSTLSLKVDATTLGMSPKLKAATTRSHDGTIKPAVKQKAAELRERFNELRLEFEGGYAVVFRAYDEGVAYRWETSLPQSEVKVFAEEVGLRFVQNYFVWYPEEQSFYSHNERIFSPRALGDLAPQNLASVPAIVDANGVKLAIADADIEDYPGLWLRGTNANGLDGTFPAYPLKEAQEGDRDVRVTQAADYLAVTKGTRTYPWRVVGVAAKDGELITNPLVYLLASPSRVEDTSWIKPGKVAWDWWNANNLHGVDFKAGVNTATYKYFIDFAAANGIDYIVLDEGWYELGNLLKPTPEMNIEELVAHAKQKNVGIVFWVVWKTLEDQFEPAMAQLERWGAKGIKVDFMQRDDQKMMEYYHRVSREAAKRKMLVDFHGAIRPAALTRTWPNLISAEGVRGLEWNKWSSHITPEHDATLPFTRMFIGPMDYTPGATRNANRGGFAYNHFRPMSQGTRCHQLGLYVVFESPLQMLADTPTNYEEEPEMMEFLRVVPSVWDETKVLDARIGDYIIVARRSGKEWFIGAITDWESREIEVDLAFLGEGKFVLQEWKDGVNADRHAEDFKVEKRDVTKATKLKVRLAEGGGWAARVTAP